MLLKVSNVKFSTMSQAV